MRPEKVDRLATVIILILTGLVGLVLFALLAYLLLSGIPHISWHFLTSSAESFRSGGGIRDQLFNSRFDSFSIVCCHLFKRIRTR